MVISGRPRITRRVGLSVCKTEEKTEGHASYFSEEIAHSTYTDAYKHMISSIHPIVVPYTDRLYTQMKVNNTYLQHGVTVSFRIAVIVSDAGKQLCINAKR